MSDVQPIAWPRPCIVRSHQFHLEGLCHGITPFGAFAVEAPDGTVEYYGGPGSTYSVQFTDRLESSRSLVPHCPDCDEPDKCGAMGCGAAAMLRAGILPRGFNDSLLSRVSDRLESLESAVASRLNVEEGARG